MGVGAYVKLANWITDRIDQVSKWLKHKNRRDDVREMDKAVDNNDDTTIGNKLCKFEQKAKDRDDSR